MSNVFDFIRAKDPRYSNPLFNLLNAGKEVRQNVNNLWNNGIFGTPEQQAEQYKLMRTPPSGGYVDIYQNSFLARNKDSPSFSVPLAGFMAEMMPVLGDAIAIGEIYEELQKSEPNYYLIGAIGGLSVIPFLPKSATDAVIAGARSVGKGIESASTAVVNRLNQPGEMPVVGSNLGNIGHNQGPPLEPDELIPPAKPTFIPEYSPSLKAATELPQEKGTYNQMRSMLLKRGAKEEELEWSAFDKYFRDKDQVFKSDIIDYLEKNAGSNMIDEVSKTARGILDEDSFLGRHEMIDRYVDQNRDEAFRDMMEVRRKTYLEDPAVRQNNYKIFKANELEKDEFENFADHHGFPGVWDDEDQLDNFRTYLYEEFEGPETYVKFDDGVIGRPAFFRGIKDKDAALDELMDEDAALEEVSEELYAYADELDVTDLREQIGLGPVVDSEQMQMPEWSEFFTKGAEDYTRKTYGYKDPEGLRAGPYAQHTNEHWPEKDVMVHTRVGKFPLLNGSGSVHHVGEIQSDYWKDIHTHMKQEKGAVREFEKLLKENKQAAKTGFNADGTPYIKADKVLLDSYNSNYEFAKKQLAEKKSATKDEVDILTQKQIAIDKEYEIVRRADKFLEDHYKTIQNSSSNPYALVEYNKDLSNDMFDWRYGQGKYEESRKDKVYNYPSEDQQFERNRGNAKAIFSGIHLFEYLTDKNVTSPLAKSFRKQKFEGEDVSEAFSKIEKDIQAGNMLRIGARDLSGAPLVSSTNKWVDFALRKELRNAVASGSDYMTIGSPDMVKRMTGGDIEGQKEFYGKIVPKRLEELIKKFDKDAKVEVVEIQTAADKNIIRTKPESKGQWKVLGVKLTDKLVNAMAEKGMPIFGYLPGAVGVGGAGVLASQASQENQPGGVLNQF